MKCSGLSRGPQSSGTMRRYVSSISNSAGHFDVEQCDVLQNLINHFRAVCVCLDDPELPVRIQAALALTELITSHDSGRVLTSSHGAVADIACTYSEGGSCSPSRQSHSGSVGTFIPGYSLINSMFRVRSSQNVRRHRPGYPQQQHGDHGGAVPGGTPSRRCSARCTSGKFESI